MHANLTRSDYNGSGMLEVNISELKARLSHYVRLAENGEEVLVKDRDRPVARLARVSGRPSRMETIPPRISLKELDEWVAANPGPRFRRIKSKDLKDAIRWNKQDLGEKK